MTPRCPILSQRTWTRLTLSWWRVHASTTCKSTSPWALSTSPTMSMRSVRRVFNIELFCIIMNELYCIIMNELFCIIMNELFCIIMNELYCIIMNELYCIFMNELYCIIMNELYRIIMNEYIVAKEMRPNSSTAFEHSNQGFLPLIMSSWFPNEFPQLAIHLVINSLPNNSPN